tara:strand:+ start:175 stop:459 length:285 start_codon:yes stop_codon:yes gene_type:complete
MPKEKKFVQYVEPTSTSYLEYEVLGRTVKKGFDSDEHIVTRKKICKGNPEETFETEEVVSYLVPHSVSDVKVSDTQSTEVTQKIFRDDLKRDKK